MLLGLPDPDPSLFVRIRILPSTSKTVSKNLDFFTVLWRLFDFLALKTKINVPSKRNKQNNSEFFFFLLVSCQPLTRIMKGSAVRSRIRKLVVRIRGSGSESIPKCHGSTTLYSCSCPERPGISCPFRSRLSHLYIFFLSLTPYSSFFGLDTAFLVIFFSFPYVSRSRTSCLFCGSISSAYIVPNANPCLSSPKFIFRKNWSPILKRENQFLSKEICESIWVISTERSVNPLF